MVWSEMFSSKQPMPGAAQKSQLILLTPLCVFGDFGISPSPTLLYTNASFFFFHFPLGITMLNSPPFHQFSTTWVHFPPPRLSILLAPLPALWLKVFHQYSCLILLGAEQPPATLASGWLFTLPCPPRCASRMLLPSPCPARLPPSLLYRPLPGPAHPTAPPRHLPVSFTARGPSRSLLSTSISPLTAACRVTPLQLSRAGHISAFYPLFPML